MLFLMSRGGILQKQNREKGNVLIIAFSLGLLVIVATSLALFNSSKDKTNPQGGSNTGQVVVIQDITDWNSVGLMPTNIPPKLGSIARWERQSN